MSIKLNAQSGGSVALDAPTQTTGSADNIYKLPIADGSAGQVLMTDGSGNLSWKTPSKILQVVSTTKVDSFATTSSSFVDVTGLSRTITPIAANSKIYIIIDAHVGGNASAYPAFKVLRGSTVVTQGTNGTGNMTNCSFGTFIYHGSITQMENFNFLDSPSYSVGDTLTYKVQMAARYNNIEVTINRNSTGVNATYSLNCTSTITLMEVAA